MSEALYRKYRPQTFDDVVGQTHIERTLKNAIESDKVSHAYLFCGPRGTGKTTTARLLAKALLCESGPTPSPDGTCEQCLAIAEGTHPDVSELDAASRTGVENVREEIIGRVQYAPTRGRSKIYIIDEVHMLSTAAFNALLKTLEEPPSHVVFILCTTDPQKVPDTIHSRCQRFDFHRLSNEEIVSRLGAVCMAEGVQFEGDALDLVAHRAQGGMRDALTTLEQLIAFGNGNITVDVARSVLGSFDVDDMSVIAGHIASRNAAACFTWMAEYVETGADLAQFARDLATYVRDLYVLALTDGTVAISAAQSSLEHMGAEAARFGTDRLAYILRVLGDLNTELRSSANPRLSFEIALTRMVRPASDLTLESLAARVEDLEARLAAGGAVVAGAPGAPGVSGVTAAGAAASAANSPVVAGGSGAAQAASRAGVPGAAGVVQAGYAAAPIAGGEAVRGGQAPVASTPSARAAAAPQGSASSAQPPAQPATVPPATRGYKPVEPEGAAAASSVSPAAQDKAAVFREQLQRRHQTQANAAHTAPAAFAGGVHAAGSPQAAALVSTSAPAQAPVSAQAPSPLPAAVPNAADSSTANAATPAPSPAASTSASGALAAKLSNPAALQRGWQAALAELKRQRAAYGALMLSARATAAADGSGIAVEFSKENTFAYAAAQKPDISQALAQALAVAFGEAVPFTVTQVAGVVGGGQQTQAAQPAQAGGFAAGRHGAAPTTQVQTSAPAPQAPSASQAPFAPPAWEDDVVPYDDADVAAYESGDAAPFDEAAVNAAAPQGSNAHAGAQHGLQAAPGPGVSFAPAATAAAFARASASHVEAAGGGQEGPAKPKLAAAAQDVVAKDAAAKAAPQPVPPDASAQQAVEAVWESSIKPVDPYAAGKKLGFDSMPSAKQKKSKSQVNATGWPGVGKKKRPAGASAAAQEAASRAVPAAMPESRSDAAPTTPGVQPDATPIAPEVPFAAAPAAAAALDPATARELAPAAAQVPAAPEPPAVPAAPTVPPRPNPFAGRAMPKGIGSGGAGPAAAPFAAQPAAPDAPELPIEEIFGLFGVTMENVTEQP